MVALFKKIAESKFFHDFILLVILGAGTIVGLETYPYIAEAHGRLFRFLDDTILAIFVVEIIIKMGAHGRKPWHYFQDPWNVFDFSIIAVCLLPLDTNFLAVLRLARLLRVLRLVTVLPRLEFLVGALLKSLPSIFYIGLLLMLHFYIYAVMGTFLFAKNDPSHFGSLPVSMLTLFDVVTLEGWVNIMSTQMYGSDKFPFEMNAGLSIEPSASPVLAPFFFVTFILLGTMIMLNLFIGVIINSMSEMEEEQRIKEMKKTGTGNLFEMIGTEMITIEVQLDELRNRFRYVQHELSQHKNR